MNVTRSCVIVVGVLQLLLAGLHAWIIVDLSITGTVLTTNTAERSSALNSFRV